MTIALACDHGGFPLMQDVKAHLDELKIEYKDFGTHSTERCDYPDFAAAAAHAIANGEYDFGIFICSTGIGISMAANKVHGIRAALCSDCYSAEYTRRHNNANVLCMGSLVLGKGLANKIVDTFLEHEFDGGRHIPRVNKLADIEEGRL
ncbi:MAG: ribose 5-phosphate isomerase B [Oscillospiraceae bacterium]